MQAGEWGTRADSEQISGVDRRRSGLNGKTPSGSRQAPSGLGGVRAGPRELWLRNLWLCNLISGSLCGGQVSCRTFRVGQLRSRVFGLVTDPPEPLFLNSVFVNSVPANSVLVELRTQHRIGRLTQVFV